ncbi:MAG: CBS domain-containing protein, partial [Candidatus Omnitrophota bacterium]
FTPPIYVLFFVLVGARLELKHITFPIFILVVSYLIFGLSGKIIGAYIGARLSKAPATVCKYLPFGLFSQAGIAIGLSILAAQHFPGEVGNTLIVVIAATTFVTQMIGPPFTKFAVTRAGEVGLNITEEDIMDQTKASDIMDKNPPVIYENMKLGDILKIFSESENLYYPVVNSEKKLAGILTVEGIKQTILETDAGDLILAHDLMESPVCKVSAETPSTDVMKALNMYNIDYLPVVDSDESLAGFIERKRISKFISTRILELQRHTDSLG